MQDTTEIDAARRELEARIESHLRDFEIKTGAVIEDCYRKHILFGDGDATAGRVFIRVAASREEIERRAIKRLSFALQILAYIAGIATALIVTGEL